MTNSKLSKNEMRKVLGGVGSGNSSCSITCKDGTTISITCNSSCSAVNEKYISCPDTGVTQYCPDGGIK